MRKEPTIEDKPEALVLIAGMHRSGTSALARLTNLVGVDLGPREALLQSSKENAAGFWEHDELKVLNEDILHALGGSWSRPPDLTPGWASSPDLDDHRRHAALVLARSFTKSGPAGFKDPRTSLLTPFWRSVHDVPVQVIYAVRHPNEVVHSLLARQDASLAWAEELWVRYTVALVQNEPEALVVRYDDILQTPGVVADRIAAHLGLDPISEAVRAEVTTFVDPRLHRSTISDTISIAPATLALYEAITAHDLPLAAQLAAELPLRTDALPMHDEPTPDEIEFLQARAAAFAASTNRLAEIEHDRVDLLKRLRVETDRRADFQKRVAASDAELAELDAIRLELLREVARLNESSRKKRARIARFESQNFEQRWREAGAELAQMRPYLEATLDERDDFRDKWQEAGGELGTMRPLFEQAVHDRDELRARVNQLENDAMALTGRLAAEQRARGAADQNLQAARTTLGRKGVRLAIRLTNLSRRFRRSAAPPASPLGGEPPSDPEPAPVASLTAPDRTRAEPILSRDEPVHLGDLGPDLHLDLVAEPADAGAPETETASADDPASNTNVSQRHFDQSFAARLQQLGSTTVLIPVYRAAALVERCLASVIDHTPTNVRVVVIDDGSADPDVDRVLAEAAHHDNVTVLRNETNLGFTATVNRGIGEAGQDNVVLLNSDTRVTPRWLDNLRFAAASQDRIGTVTPLSNNAGAFSAPLRGTNVMPPQLELDGIGRQVTRAAIPFFPEVPTGNGFCMFIRRALIDDIGTLDEASFPRGYGEENDFCMRADGAGWHNIIDDRTIIFHELGASFGSEREELLQVGRATLDRLHPNYTERVRRFLDDARVETCRERVAIALEREADEPALPRVMFSMHKGTGGTPQTNADLMDELDDRLDAFLFKSDSKRLTVERVISGGQRVVVREHTLAEPIEPDGSNNIEYANFVREALISLGIELVHIRQLMHHSLDLPQIVADLSIPIVMSFHDFLAVCPTVHLLDHDLTYCGGTCTPGDGECAPADRWLSSLPTLKHNHVHTWRETYARSFPLISAFVTTSQSARATIAQAYPQLDDDRFHVIEHGRNIEQVRHNVVPHPNRPIDILVPGNIGVHKGAEVIRRLEEIDTDKRLRFTVLGRRAGGYEDIGLYLGKYEREDFARKARLARPSFVAVFSIWAETYSHTLSEAWAAGIPVLAFDYGAVAERIATHGGGWILDDKDLDHCYSQILEIAADVDGYRQAAAKATTANLRTTEQMGAAYWALYDNAWTNRTTPSRVLA